VQADTLDGQPLEIAGTSAALPRMAELCSAFRAAGQAIVHVVRLYLADGSNAEPSRQALVRGPVPVLRPGTPGRMIATDLLPPGAAPPDDDLLLGGGIQELAPDEVVLYKPRWGAFFRTPLDDHLRGLGVTTLVFAGCNFPNCPRTSMYEASERDYAVVLADDAISGLYDRGREELTGIGVECLPTQAILERVATG
jgi:nicotinamidase-related amidase